MRFNWGAFLMPWFWGVAHGHWPGVLFLPAWVFVDNAARGPRPFGVWTVALAVAMGGGTLALQAAFALHADRVAWERSRGTLTAEEYARRQRIWARGAFAVTAGAVAWIAAYVLFA